MTLTASRMYPGVLLSSPVLLTYHGVILIQAPPDVVSAKTSFVKGINSVCGSNIIGAIPWSTPGFIGGSIHGWSGYSIFFFKIPVASVINCFQIEFKIALLSFAVAVFYS